MNGDKSQTFKKYLTASLLGLAAASVAAYASGLGTANNTAEAASAICDGLFIASVLLLGGGGLALAANEGTFDMLRYSASLAIRIMTLGKFHKKDTSYAEFVQARRSRRGEWLHIVIVGAAYLLAAFISLAVYYKIK